RGGVRHGGARPPPAPLPRRAGPAGSGAAGRPVGQHRPGHGEGPVGGGDSGVDGGLEEHLPQFVGSDAVAERPADMDAELVLVAERRQQGDGDAGAGAAVEVGAAPDVAPGVAGDEVLKGSGEVVAAGEGTVDVLVAQHGPADGQAGVEIGHGSGSSPRVAWRRTAAVTSSSVAPRTSVRSRYGRRSGPMLARMRSASTSRWARQSASQAAAEPVTTSSSR